MQPAPRRATEDTDHRARVTQPSITQGILKSHPPESNRRPTDYELS